MIEDQTQQEGAQKSSSQKWAWWALAGGCGLVACAGIAVALVLILLGPWTGRVFSQVSVGPSDTPQAEVVIPDPNPRPQADGNAMGDPNAPVKIIEYADFQCPYCLRFWQETEAQIVESYVASGKVYFEYRSVGDFIGPESAAAAEAAYCAGDQGKFWEYHDVLYANWTGENVGDFTEARLHQYATAIGLDENTFANCLKNGTHADQVKQDVSKAQADGVHATPSFLINGKLVEGAQPFDVFKREIEAALQGK